MSRTNVERIPHFVDSSHRDLTSTSNEDMTITLDESLSRVKKVNVQSIEIPYSYYVLNVNNNVIDFNDNAAAFQQVTIDPGNYTGTQFANEVQTQLNAVYAGFTVSYNLSTYKLDFSNATNFELLVSGTASEILGLTADSGVVTSFTCQGICDLSGPNFLIIRSDTLTRPMRRKPLENKAQSNVFAKVPVVTGPGSVINVRTIVPVAYDFAVRQTISTIDFKLEDPNGNVLDLNGLRWSISLVYDIQ